MTEKELMSFAIARSNDPIIKNPVLRDAMNKDLGPRIKVAERDNMNTPDLEQSPDSFLRPGETLEDFDVEFRRPNSDGGLIDEALDAYKYYLKTRKSRPSKKRYKEIPFTKFFEIYGRENFDDGGRIALGVGGMPYKIFGKNIDIPKIPGVQGPEQNKKSVETGFKKLEKWLTDPTPENWVKTFGKNNTFGRQLRAYLLDEPIDLRKGTGLKETNKKVFDAINVKQLLKPNSIEKINLLTTGGKDVSLKSIAAKTFGNLKYTLDEQIKEVENFQNGEQWLKRNRSESEIRKYANAIRSMQSEKSRLGGFPFGDNSEKKLWSNLYRASYRGDRIEIVGDFADGNLPINKDGKVDWKMVDKNNVPAWKRIQFVDLEAPKNTSFTWGGDFKKGDLEKQIDNTFGKGFFKKSTAAYDTQIKTGSKRDFTVEGGGKTIKNNVKVKLLTAEALAENPKATKTEIDKYIKDKSPRFNITEVHHPDGVGVNPYKTEPTFRYANRAVGKVELALKAGKINQAEAKIQIDKINKDIGPVRIKLDDGYYGNYKNTQKSIVEASNNYIKVLKKMGFRCNKAGGGAEDVACYLEDVKKTKADARSSDVLKRAKALTKERKALSVAKTLPKVGNIIRKGVQVGAGAVSSALSAVGFGPVGVAIEAAIEGGFYDNARRNGYTHEQAYAETFLPKLITDAAGTTNTNTKLFEGADAMIEKEKLGKEDSLASKFNNAQNIYFKEATKLDNMVNSYLAMEGTGVSKKNLDAFLEKIDQQEAKVRNLTKAIKPGTPEYEAYKIAEENQAGRIENRKNDYLSMNRIPYVDENFEIQEKTFPLSPEQIKLQEKKLQSKIRSGDKRRDKEMQEYKTDLEGNILPPTSSYDFSKFKSYDDKLIKFEKLREIGGLDLTDKIGLAGGVANMAQGGIMSLKKK